MYPEAEQIKQILAAAQKIVVLQADNPDGDSLGSALALEEILGEQGKDVQLYCGVDMPSYLKYLPGADRVSKELPTTFDASIIVDASTLTLMEKLSNSGQQGWIASRPCIVLDHHTGVVNTIGYATVTINDPNRSSTGELIYALTKQIGWEVPAAAFEPLMTAILGDTQGLSNNLTSPETYCVMAELVEAGANRPALEEKRREFIKMEPEIFRYKAELIQRTEFSAKGRITTVTVPQTEINDYSPLYNPAPLIQSDMLQTKGVKVAIVFKQYGDGKITAAIRCNIGAEVGDTLAEHFGGGGHPYASGFKITNGRPFNEVKSECIEVATQLLDTLEQGTIHESLQQPE